MTDLKPCPFCGGSVHWDDSIGITHDRVEQNCIVDMVWPMESNMNLPKEVWIKKWNMGVRVPNLKPCPFCGNSEYNEVCHPAPNFATWMVICGECSSTGSERDTKKDAIEAWNRRVKE